MASSIDNAVPATNADLLSSPVRANFGHAKSEIEALQEGTGLASGVVTNAKLANMAASTFKMRVTASTGVPEDGTATQARAVLDPIPQLVNAQTGTTYTLLMADKNKLVTFTNAANIAVTVETTTATWSSGDRVDLLNTSSGAVTVTVSGSGVTVNKAADQTLVLASGKGASLVFTSDSVCWMVGGMGAA